jgi:hypothetical protein
MIRPIAPRVSWPETLRQARASIARVEERSRKERVAKHFAAEALLAVQKLFDAREEADAGVMRGEWDLRQFRAQRERVLDEIRRVGRLEIKK